MAYYKDASMNELSQQIKELYNMLSPSEQQGLLLELSANKILSQPKQGDVTSCPYCHDGGFVKNGNHKGHPRYKCKSCNRNFSALTGTAFQGIKKLDKFEQYKTIMFEEGFVPLEKMAKRVCISIQTAFDWRHKILSTLKPEQIDFMGITEMDDVWVSLQSKRQKGFSLFKKTWRE